MIDPEKIARRVAKLSTEQLTDWADLAASGMQQHLDKYRRDPVEDHLAEISLAALTMGVVVDELALRMKQQREMLARQDHQE